MNLPKNKKTTLAAFLTFAIPAVLIGILLIALDAAFLLRIVFIVMGIVTVLYNIPAVVAGLAMIHTRGGQLSLVLSLISLVLGFVMIFWHDSALMIILGVYMIVLPILQIICSKDRLLRLNTELPKLIIGVVLLLIGPARALGVVFDIAGWLILIFTAIYAVSVIIREIRIGKKVPKTGGRIFADTTGDGKIDTVYMDTTGDGKPDTATEYRSDK